jgi:hypothetical protein
MSKKKRKGHSDPCWEKSGKFNHHHNIAKSFGGKWTEENIFVWDVNAHRAFHFLFGRRTLLEAAEWLIYIHEMNEQGCKVDILSGTYDDNTLS